MTDEKYYVGIRAKGAAKVFVFGPYSYQEALKTSKKVASPNEWDLAAAPILAESEEEATQWAEWELGLRPEKPIKSAGSAEP